MSNLVTPMLTSVDSSPTVDFYQSSMRFPNSPCAIIKNRSDQICDASEWNDLEQLVERTSLFKASTPNKSHSIAYNRKIFGNNCSVSNDNSKIIESRPYINEYVHEKEYNVNVHNAMEQSKVIDNLWNISNSENNSCSKACVNVNMGYNEGSSLESMVSNKKTKPKNDFTISRNGVELSNINQADPIITKPPETIPNVPFILPSTTSINNNYQVKTFKNGSKSGHSRQWGSCGSAGTFHLNFDDTTVKTKLSQALKPMNALNTSTNAFVTPSSPSFISTTTASTATSAITEIRNKLSSQNNRMKRISQVSFEAEFDSEGRTHEQITIDFLKYDPNTMSGQITLIEMSYFKVIKSEEFLSFKWTGLSKHTHAPGIVASTRWFNQLNFWAQRIILECNELNRRSEMLIYLIRIIKKLVDGYNNLSSAMALMSALEVECIHRLKQTWNTLPNKDRATYRRMEDLFSSANNFEKLRDHINSLKLPCIPYLGLYLTDLTYINIAHSKLSEFESQTKTDQINNILRTVSEFQQSEYDIPEIALLYRYLESQRYIEELQKIIEENNYRTSISLEPNPDSSCQNTRQQQDCPTFGSTSPQKTPPSYACKHVPGVPSLQLPISPKPMSSKPHNETINEVPEQTQQQVILTSVDDQSLDNSVNDNLDPENDQTTIVDDCTVVVDLHGNCSDVGAYEDSAMFSSRHSDDDSVKMTFLCGTGKKSQFKKRNSTTASQRYGRSSQSSSRKRMNSKTTTMSSTSQSDKEQMGHHSKSLLDDSYLDATMGTEAGPGAASADVPGQHCGSGLSDLSAVTGQQSDAMFAPPICRCIFKGDGIDLKPKATIKKSQAACPNLKQIGHAAKAAAQFSEKVHFYYPNDSDNESSTLDIDDQDSFRLVCQGVLSRMVCLKNSKKSRFSMWNRQWMVLMMSRNNAFMVFFENSQFRAIDRKDFKSKKCHVQDLRRVVVSRVRPTMDRCVEEYQDDLCHRDSSASSDQHQQEGTSRHCDRMRKFFLTDTEYGTVYKFRDPSTSKTRQNTTTTTTSTNEGGGRKDKVRGVSMRRKGSDSGAGGGGGGGGGGDTVMRDGDGDECVMVSDRGAGAAGGGVTMPSISQWYHCLQRCLRAVSSVADDNKDLIVLGDT